MATGDPVKVATVADRPAHAITLETVFTPGVGLTVIENVVDAPVHVLEKGDTVI